MLYDNVNEEIKALPFCFLSDDLHQETPIVFETQRNLKISVKDDCPNTYII